MHDFLCLFYNTLCRKAIDVISNKEYETRHKKFYIRFYNIAGKNGVMLRKRFSSNHTLLKKKNKEKNTTHKNK